MSKALSTLRWNPPPASPGCTACCSSTVHIWPNNKTECLDRHKSPRCAVSKSITLECKKRICIFLYYFASPKTKVESGGDEGLGSYHLYAVCTTESVYLGFSLFLDWKCIPPASWTTAVILLRVIIHPCSIKSFLLMLHHRPESFWCKIRHQHPLAI